MRIASLVPSATEALFALGLGDQVVAVTHECDHPAAATELPRLTASVIEGDLAPDEIDSRVRELTGRGESLYRLDEARLAELEPDLIVTQALCAVCAVSFDDVRAIAERIPSRPRVISLDPTTLDQVLDDLLVIADAGGDRDRGRRLAAALRTRIETVSEAVAGRDRPRVAALEWLDPIYVGGHWVPEMIAAAGGDDVLGAPGARSRVVEWAAVARAHPEDIVWMPCGLYAVESAAQARDHAGQLRELGATAIAAVDAASSFSRPGPRLADGIELLGHLLHPEVIRAPAQIGFELLGAVRLPG